MYHDDIQYLTLKVMRSICCNIICHVSNVYRIIYVSVVYHGMEAYNKVAHIKHGVSCQSVIINYVSEHQLSYAIDAFHTTLITHVNRGPMLLKLIGLRSCPYFGGSHTYPGPRPRCLALNQALPPGNQ